MVRYNTRYIHRIDMARPTSNAGQPDSHDVPFRTNGRPHCTTDVFHTENAPCE